MIKVTLLPSELIRKEERKEIFVIACIAVAVLFGLGMLRYTIKVAYYRNLQVRIGNTQQELNKYESIVRQVEALQATKTVLETKKNVINSLMAWRLTYPVFMEDMLQLLPANIWFTALTTQSQPEGRMTVSLNALALDNYSIADLITSFSSNPSYSNVEVGAITTGGDKTVTSSFKLDFAYQKKKQ